MLDELNTRQIVALSKDGMSSGEIASSLGIEEAAVKLVMNRNEVGSAVDRDIDDDQLAALRRHAVGLALGAEDEGVQARMTMFLIERDKPKERSVSSPIVQINQALISANETFKKMVETYQTT